LLVPQERQVLVELSLELAVQYGQGIWSEYLLHVSQNGIFGIPTANPFARSLTTLLYSRFEITALESIDRRHVFVCWMPKTDIVKS